MRGKIIENFRAQLPQVSTLAKEFVTQNRYRYRTATATNGVYKFNIFEKTMTNSLLGTLTKTNYQFGPYFNLAKETVTYGGAGTVVTDYKYDNNSAGTGASYYIGCPSKVSTTSTIGGNMFKKIKKYAYDTFNNPTTITEYGADTER